MFQTISSEMGTLFSCTYLGFVLSPFSEPVKGLEPASSWATGVLLLVLPVVDTIECWWYRFIISSWQTGAGSWSSKSLSHRAKTFFLFWYLKFKKKKLLPKLAKIGYSNDIWTNVSTKSRISQYVSTEYTFIWGSLWKNVFVMTVIQKLGGSCCGIQKLQASLSTYCDMVTEIRNNGTLTAPASARQMLNIKSSWIKLIAKIE